MEFHLILRAPIRRVSKDEVKSTHYPRFLRLDRARARGDTGAPHRCARTPFKSAAIRVVDSGEGS